MAKRHKCYVHRRNTVAEEAVLRKKQLSPLEPEMKIRRQETRKGQGCGNSVVRTGGERNRFVFLILGSHEYKKKKMKKKGKSS